MSSKCNGSPVSSGLRRRRLQRARTAIAIRENAHGMVRRFGIERIALMTLTFAKRVTDAKEAQRHFKSLRTGVLHERYGGYLWVMERTASGAIHYHVLVPMSGDIRSGYQRPQHPRGRTRANDLLRSEWAFLNKVLPRYSFGRVHFEPILESADHIAAYLAKTLEVDDPIRAVRDKGIRVFDVSRSMRVANTRISYLSPGAKQWRRKLHALVYARIETGELPLDAGFADLNRSFGPAWALLIRPILLAMPDMPLIRNGSLGAPPTPPSILATLAIDRRLRTSCSTIGALAMTASPRPSSALLELHSLCTMFPPIDDEGRNELIADIQENGLRQPIVLFEGKVLDGRNRYHACLSAGIEARFREYGSDPGDGDDPVKFVLSLNLKRRHMTLSQQAAVVAMAQDWTMAQQAHRPTKAGTGSPFSTVAERAALSGASERTQKDADLVAREAPELIKKVAAGEISAKAAAKQVREAKRPEPAAPSEQDFYDSDEIPDAPPTYGREAEPTEKPEPTAKPAPVPKPADPRDERIAELEEEVTELHESLTALSEENETLRAAGSENAAAEEIRQLKIKLATSDSQGREWQIKCNELIKQVKWLQKVIKRLESGR